jgi:hypothetical protein
VDVKVNSLAFFLCLEMAGFPCYFLMVQDCPRRLILGLLRKKKYIKIAINEIYLALQLSEFLAQVLLSVSAHFWLTCQYTFRID